MAFSNTRLVLMAVVVFLSLSACGRQDPAARSEPLDNFTAEQIYKRGEYELENRARPRDAVHYFSEIERLYPYSEWAKRALIMQAYSHHKAKQYDEARGAAQREQRAVRPLSDGSSGPPRPSGCRAGATP